MIQRVCISNRDELPIAGFFEGVLDAKSLEGLATMPGKDELRAKLLATFQAPATDLVRTINAGAQNFMYLLSAKERAAGGEATK